MATIIGFNKRIQGINSDEIITRAMDATVPFIKAKIIEQLYAGYDGTGNKIGDRNPYQNPVYAESKNRANPAPGEGNPDLYVTGRYYGGIRVQYQNGVIHSESTDIKGPDLEAKYPDNLTLGGTFKQEIINGPLRQNINAEITAATGLKVAI